MEDGVFPHVRSLNSVDELEEERRLAYVGITRARERLYLTHALCRSLWGGTNYNIKSRFLKEIPGEFLRSAYEEKEPCAAKLPDHSAAAVGAGTGGRRQSFARQSHVELAVGDQVMHKKFGKGKVVAMKGAGQVTVVFPTEGEKTLLLDYAPLEKVD